MLQARIQIGEKELGRRPTQEEVEAYAYWNAKSLQLMSYGRPVGYAGGFYRAYSTRNIFAFPFFKPNLEKFNPLSFLGGALKGRQALFAWHFLRYTSYSLAGDLLGRLFFNSYATTVAIVGIMSDPRLKAEIDALKARAKERSAEASGKRKGGLSEGNETSFPPPDPAWQRSPAKKPWPRAPTYPLQEDEPDNEPEEPQFPEVDDASPTGGQGMSSDSDIPQENAQQGSAWDRLRSDAQSGSNSKQLGTWQKANEPAQQNGQGSWSKYQQNTKQESMEGSSDTYSYSKSEEQRHLAREQAQAEFDAQVERERQGGDFSSESRK